MADVQFRYEPFSLYEYVGIVDARLASICPPSNVQRGTRSIILDLSYFANEFKPLFFYYLPVVLEDLMEKTYFNHFCKFLCALEILCCESISPEDVVKADKLLNAFVCQFQVLYDPRFMSTNNHLLRHFGQTVSELGPLWVTSCMPGESLNGKLVRMVHGTRHVGLQMQSAVAHGLILPYLVSKMPESKAKTFCERLLSSKKKQKLTAISRDFSVIGNLVDCDIVPEDVRNVLAGHDYGNVRIFYRLRNRKLVYYSPDYKKKQKKNSRDWAIVLAIIMTTNIASV